MTPETLESIADSANAKYDFIRRLVLRYPEEGLRRVANYYFRTWRELSPRVSALREAREHPESESVFGNYLWGKSYLVYYETDKALRALEKVGEDCYS